MRILRLLFVHVSNCRKQVVRAADPQDPIVYGAVVAVLSAIALLSCYPLFLCSNVVRRIFINADELDHFLVQ